MTEAWMADARCIGMDPELFFPTERAETAPEAQTACIECPVWQECRTYALTHHPLEGGTVLDPFSGSASTGIAARAIGRKAVLIEQREQQCEAAAKRLSQGILNFGGVA